MKYKNIVDVHTHSIHSFDGNDSVEALCLAAIEKGAKVLAVTDHCDIDGKDMVVDELCPPQLKDLNDCINKYGDEIEILKGIEIGQGIYRKKAPISRQNTLSTTRRYHNSYNRERKSPPYFQDYEASLKQNHNRIF